MDRIAEFDSADYVTRRGDQLEPGQTVAVLVRVADFGAYPTRITRLLPRHIGDVACVVVTDADERSVVVNAVNVDVEWPYDYRA